MATENLNAGKEFDLIEDESTPSLSGVWDALDSPIYRIVDEDGVNVAEGQIRRLDRSRWLYVDEVDGYSILDQDDVGHLVCVPEADHVPLGWDRSGNVVEL